MRTAMSSQWLAMGACLRFTYSVDKANRIANRENPPRGIT